ncbi:MAG: hypothetical protein SYNGOMJ08_00375 [Candidatus Syntrophoarchaeum sp. GoM_oil]|nr:MAG: hypothetical protein SYNGOMJ08_00375 [Candidatus Syntrophoarchaeum sp. GoM_oil]
MIDKALLLPIIAVGAAAVALSSSSNNGTGTGQQHTYRDKTYRHYSKPSTAPVTYNFPSDPALPTINLASPDQVFGGEGKYDATAWDNRNRGGGGGSKKELTIQSPVDKARYISRGASVVSRYGCYAQKANKALSMNQISTKTTTKKSFNTGYQGVTARSLFRDRTQTLLRKPTEQHRGSDHGGLTDEHVVCFIRQYQHMQLHT